MPIPKRLIVETDGDRYPRDIYLVDENGMRVCTFTDDCARRMSEVPIRHLASAVAAAYNQVHGAELEAKKPKSKEVRERWNVNRQV